MSTPAMTRAELLVRGMADMEVFQWGLSDGQLRLSLRSPVFRELMRQCHEADRDPHRQAGRSEREEARWELAGRPVNAIGNRVIPLEAIRTIPDPPDHDHDHNLMALWRVAGEPAHNRPEALAPEIAEGLGETIDDRGEAGIFAGVETAAWYAQELCDQIDVSDIISWLY